MAGKISIECPACAAKLNLADSSKLGKKIKCPKCSKIFVAASNDDDEIIEDDDDEIIEDDDDEIIEDDDDVDDEPKQLSSRKRTSGGGRDSAKGSRKGAGKGKSTEGNSNLPMIIGGVVALLGVIGGGLYLAGVFNSKPLPEAPNTVPAPMVAAPVQATPPAPPPISPAEKMLGLRWMPAETDLLIHIKLADVWQAPLLKEPLSSPMVTQGLDEFKKKFGMLPSDIETISIGFVDSSGFVMKSMSTGLPPGGPGFSPAPAGPGFGGPPMPMMSPQDVHLLIVMKTKTPMDLQLFSAGIPNAKLQEKNGKSFFEVPANPLEPANGGWLVDSTTMIFATTKELLAAMERGETNVPRKEFKSIDHLPQLVIAGVVPTPKKSSQPTSEGAQNLAPGSMPDLLKVNDEYGVQLASLGLSVKGGFDLQISTLCATDDGTKKIKAALEKQLGELRTMFDGFKATAPPLIAELGEMLLANLKIEDKSQSVKLSTNIPDSAREKLEQLPPVIMMMAMMGGIGGGLGGPMVAAPDFGASPGSFPLNQAGANPSFKLPNESETLPGETDSVESASVEGLPEGMTLTARTAWGTSVAEVGAGGTPSAAESPASHIVILLDFQGDGLEGICAATGVSSKTVKLDGGVTLKKTKLVLPGGVDAQKTFIPFDLENVLPFEHPPETLRLKLAVELPTIAVTEIKLLEGSFKYLTTGNSQELTIENVPQTAKQPLKGAEFKAGGVKLIRGPKDVVPETLKLECGKDYFLSRVRGNPGNLTSMTEVEKGAIIQRIYANKSEGKFPEDFQIQFKLNSEVKEHTVTFRFENVPLPTPESKPQSSKPQTSPQ